MYRQQQLLQANGLAVLLKLVAGQVFAANQLGLEPCWRMPAQQTPISPCRQQQYACRMGQGPGSRLGTRSCQHSSYCTFALSAVDTVCGVHWSLSVLQLPILPPPAPLLSGLVFYQDWRAVLCAADCVHSPAGHKGQQQGPGGASAGAPVLNCILTLWRLRRRQHLHPVCCARHIPS